MKNVKYASVLLLIGMCFMLLAGCTNQEKSESVLSSKEEKLIWSSTREKPFGEYEYKNMTSEDEVMKLLTDKFNVSVPPIYQESNQLLDNNSFFKSYEIKNKSYDISIQQNTLNFVQTIYYGTEKIPQLAKSVIALTYTVNTETKKVKTTRQQVTVTTVTSESQKFYDSLADLSKTMATTISFTNPKIDETIDEAFKNNPDKNEQKNMESVTIIKQKKSENSLEKNMFLFYNNNNVVTEWSTVIVYE